MAAAAAAPAPARKRSFDEYAHDGTVHNGPSTKQIIPAPNRDNHQTSNGQSAATTPNGRFEPNATVVLLGIRGAGKSSLAFLAATAYSRRVIEYDREFLDRTGQTLTTHRQNEKNRAGRKKRQEVLLQTLNDHDQNAVIVCDFSDLEYGANILIAYGLRHPVVYVDRDVQGIHDYLSWDIKRISHLGSSSAKLLRECSNFEFFNWTESEPETRVVMTVSSQINTSDSGRPQDDLPFLKLKGTERDFLKFLRRILGDYSRAPSQQSAYPLSELPLHSRSFTYAASIEVDQVLSGNCDLESFQTGADAFRLRVSHIEKSKDRQEQFTQIANAFSVVRRATILPIILDPCNSKRHDSNDYLDVWRICCRLAPEYVTLDLDTPNANQLLATKCNSSIIGLSHVDSWENGQAEERHRQAASLGCEGALLVSSSKPEHTLDHALESFRYRAQKQKQTQASVPALSTYNTGVSGRFSQFTNGGVLLVRGAGVHPGGSQSTRCSGLTAQDATKALFSSFIYSPLNFCIVGGNVDYSLSPTLHNTAYAALGMPHTYTTRSSSSLDILSTLRLDPHFGGTAITQPYKITVIQHLDSLSPHASVIRAVNTVLPLRSPSKLPTLTDLDIVTTRNRSGPITALHGDNTDWIGIRACLRRGLSPINAVRPHSVGLIIGAGGMARAALYAMLHMGVQRVVVCNRTLARAEELATYYNKWLGKERVSVLPSLDAPWPEGWRLPTMIVSSVPAEVVDGKTEARFTLPPSLLGSPSGGVVVELTYNPLVTALVGQVLEQAAKGWVIMTGLDMLPEQAFAQFELFTGRRAPRHVMRKEVLREFQLRRNS
ncbi:hypothetical protein K461DRAFT_326587 [Myriangium duriaei CBS 260.36]|uniref:Quinate repressor protein n=1 Tax=Myriangium duriaei CBS 260.36 TaxID=1168546 RepID=A0A9P4MRC2_9PEZI|nr:hypothetical protein K461DRAFT_326587 [Myriangium duriaei CBS 260.36]